MTQSLYTAPLGNHSLKYITWFDIHHALFLGVEGRMRFILKNNVDGPTIKLYDDSFIDTSFINSAEDAMGAVIRQSLSK